MSNSSKSLYEIAADIVIAMIEKGGYIFDQNGNHRPSDVAEAYKVIYDAVRNPKD